MSELPRGWVEATLEELVDLNPRHPSNTLRKQLVSFVPMPAVDEYSGAITAHESRPLDQVWKGYTHFQDGDVIFAKITPCMENGKAAIAANLTNGLACGSTEFHVLRPTAAVDASYLWRFLRQQSFRREAERAMTGAVGQRRVPAEYLKKSILPVPPQSEQVRIVAKLDSLRARSARARHELGLVPKLIERYKQAILAKQIDTAIIDAPEFALGELLDVLTSGSRDWAKYYDKGSGVFVLAGNVRPMAFDATPRRFVDPPRDGPDARRSRIAMGDILITIVGAGTGQLCRVPNAVDDYFVCQSVALLRLTNPKLSRWVELFLNADAHGRGQIQELIYGQGRPHLGFDDIKRIAIKIPSERTLQATIQKIETSFAWLGKIATEHARAEALLPKLDQAILAKAFRGELLPQDPNDEPASVLLDCIRAEREANSPKKTTRRGRQAKAVSRMIE